MREKGRGGRRESVHVCACMRGCVRGMRMHERERRVGGGRKKKGEGREERERERERDLTIRKEERSSVEAQREDRGSSEGEG